MKNHEILRRAEGHLKAVDALLETLGKRHARRPMTHPQAVRLEELEQHCTDIKSTIGEIYEIPEPENS